MKKIKKNQPIMPKVVDILRNSIIEGELNPGERINETAIASKLGISRSPIREAIKVLESENLVQIVNLRGSFVKDLSKKEIEDLYMVNSIIHRAAIRVAAGKMNSRMEKKLKKLMRQITKAFEEADNIDKIRLLARQFHRFIIEATGNDLLLKIHDSLRIQEERFRYYTIKAGAEALTEANNEHLAIGEALLKRDADLAESIINKHFERSLVRVIDAVKKP